ncbi:MAG: phosphate ABC transporter substrate-binding protein PstS [Meiothermus sp.]|nr:phosphate ABC transporter substrate-binding protein PstS [Meiothermus sp.]
MKRTLTVATLLLAGLGIAQVTLSGAGATFPAPLYTEYFIPAFQRANPGTRINYQAVGSGAGIRQLGDRVVHFGATDAPLSDDRLAEIREKAGSEVLHIPAAMGPVAIIYNLPGVDELRLSPQVLADIYLGKILRWNDPKITAINPGRDFSRRIVSAANRSDGSGTTFIFTSYLAAVSPEWKEQVGAGQSVKWPSLLSLGGRGNAGVAALVSQTPGAIGYVELKFALENNLTFATLQNRSGNWVRPSLESATRSIAGTSIPADLRLKSQVVNTTDPQGYPIVGMTWMLVYREQSVTARSVDQARAIQQYLRWVLTEGQALNLKARYVPLPAQVVRRARELVEGMTYKGQPIR